MTLFATQWYAKLRIKVLLKNLGEALATFGQTIAEKRRALGLSQRELAARVLKEDGTQISPQYLNDLEKDRRNPPSDYLMQQFANALDIPADVLFLCAGTIPPDIRCVTVPQEQAVEAFKAFRKKIEKPNEADH